MTVHPDYLFWWAFSLGKTVLSLNIQDKDSARRYLLSRLLPALRVPCLLIAPTAKDARTLYRELAFFLPENVTSGPPGERRLYDFPVYDISPLSGLSPHRDVVTPAFRPFTLSPTCPTLW